MNVVIIGAGDGISGAFARQAHAQGCRVLLASRNVERLSALAQATESLVFPVDASNPDQVVELFERADRELGSIDLVLYNPSGRVRGPVTELDPVAVLDAIKVTAWGGFVAGQEAAKRMVKQGHGSILFTGATASVKGMAQSAAFAMGKFALRGLAQSMARELGPKNIHIAHFIIDGAVGESTDDSKLSPTAIARTYWNVATQPRSAWTWEVELRPYVETF